MKKIILTRDSVCAADDIDSPHSKEIFIDESWQITQILELIIQSKYLPSMDNSAWSAACNGPIAIIATQWELPKLICLPEFPYQGTKGFINIKYLHFNYHSQMDAETVFEVLRRYRNNAYK